MSEAQYNEILYERGKVINTERFLTQESLPLMSWNFKAVTSKPIKFTSQVLPLFKLTSINGRSHISGEGTKYLMTDGWKTIEDLQPGDLVAILFNWARTVADPCPLEELEFLYRKEKDTPEWSKKPLSTPAMRMHSARRQAYLPSINNRVPQKVFAANRKDTWKYLQLIFKLFGTRELILGIRHYKMWGYRLNDKVFLKDIQLLLAKIGFQSNLVHLKEFLPQSKIDETTYFLEIPLGDIQRFRKLEPLVSLNQYMYPSNNLKAWEEKPTYLEENENNVNIKYNFLYEKILKIEPLPQCLCYNPSDVIISSSGFIVK